MVLRQARIELRHRLRQILIVAGTLFLVSLLFLVLELAVRRQQLAAKLRGPHPSLMPIILEGWNPCCQKKSHDGKDYLVKKGVPYRGHSFNIPLQKSSSVKRIIVIGESSAGILGEAMDTVVKKHSVADRYQIMSCATGGASLTMVEEGFDELLAYSPDLILLLFGHNLFIDHPRMNSWALRLGWAARKSRLVSFISDRFLRREEPPEITLDERLKHFDNFLSRASAKLKQYGISFVVCTAPSNLWYPPVSQESDRYDRSYCEALWLYLRSKKNEAIRVLSERIRQNPGHPLWHFRLAEWLYETGDFASAKVNFQTAVDNDDAPNRAHSRLNAAVRRAKADGRAQMLDIETLITQRSTGGIPGWETFEDNCHVNPDVLELEALYFLVEIGEELPLRPSLALQSKVQPPPRLATILKQRLWSFDVSDDPNVRIRDSWAAAYFFSTFLKSYGSLGEREVERFLVSREFLSVKKPLSRSLFFIALAEGFWRAGNTKKAFQFNSRAVRELRWEEPLFQRGLFFLGMERPADAQAAFRQAQELNPDRQDIRFFLERTQ